MSATRNKKKISILRGAISFNIRTGFIELEGKLEKSQELKSQ
jgi:hypothetical protein